MPRSDLPGGTLTFLFTDIEGSTNLLHKVGPESFAGALAEHRRLLRAAFGRHGGVEVDTQGDAFFVAFPSATAAVAAAAEAQDALNAGPIRVRMGLHTGTPLLVDDGYVGADVHLGARIAAAGHGGQVLLSRTTRDAVSVDVLDLGEHRVKDFDEPVWLFQLGSGGFPPLRTLSNTNLPRPASPFLGRAREVREITDLLRDGARFMTLTGAGGSGKTRLAVEVASQLVPEFRNGVFWIGLAGLRNPALVAPTVAQVLGATQELAEHIGARQMLLLLDNFEQVIDAAPQVATLVEICPQLVVLVTSRELLQVRGETQYQVLPLPAADAVELFCRRAGTQADDQVAAVCRRLDNLPLAVELAAAQTDVLSVSQLLTQLAGGLEVLHGGRDAEDRQRTLRATIEWSYQLLDTAQRRAFARLGVFAGGCTLESAPAVAGVDLDMLRPLLRKSLLRRTDERFWMLETVREYAQDQLAGSTVEMGLRTQHAGYVLALVEQGEPMLHCGEQLVWLDKITAETGNLRSALEWTLAERPDTALRLAAAGSWFWQLRSNVKEGRSWLEAALGATPRAAATLRARALDGVGRLAYYDNDPQSASRWLDAASALWRELGDRTGLARSLTYLGVAAGHCGDAQTARVAGEEAVELASGTDDWTIAMALWALGTNHVLDRCEGADRAAARRLLEESADLFRRTGDRWGLGASVFYLGDIALVDNELNHARLYVDEALECFGAVGDKWRTYFGLRTAGEVAERAGRLADARARYQEALLLVDAVGGQDEERELLAKLAELHPASDGGHR